MSTNYEHTGATDDEQTETTLDTQTGTSDFAPTLSRPRGPSWGTVALGLICLVIAGGALFVELTDVQLDWDRSGPLALVGLGVVLVLVGLAALVRRGDSEPDDQFDDEDLEARI